jgi:hypothetical protein
MLLDDLRFPGLQPTWMDATQVVDVCFPILPQETFAAALYRAKARDLMRILVISASEAGRQYANLGRVRALIDVERDHPGMILSLLAQHPRFEVRRAAVEALDSRGCYFSDGLLYLDANLVGRFAEEWFERGVFATMKTSHST